MIKTDEGWQLPLYLREGTHTYRFIVDGKWMADATNPLRLPNEFGEYNSVIQIGKPHLFHLKGNTGATSVSVAGTFNDWRPNELLMTKTDSGWTLPYTIGPGNYQYKFIVDGKWVSDPANNVQVHDGNSFLIISPNYTFRLKGFDEAKSVFIAGDFNDWSPNSLSMKKEGNEWIFTLHLLPGKHRYKFIVDGKWILDPANRLWEQNEHHTGNSVLWIEEPGTATSRVP
jgi:1,4-alpha-glucan branching enzyme